MSGFAQVLWLSSLAPTKRLSSSAPLIPFELCSRGRRALLRRALSHLAAMPLVVEPCSGRQLSSLAPVPLAFDSGTNQGILEHCFDHPCRILLQGPLSPSPVGTVEPCYCGLSCQALLQLGDRRAPLRSSLPSFTPGAVQLCSGRHYRALLQCPRFSSFALTKRSLCTSPIIPVELCSRGR